MWQPIPGFPGYEVSELGEVRRLAGGRGARPNRVLTAQVNKTNGYVYVHLWERGKRTALRLHRVVATAYHGPGAPGQVVNHKDGDRLNNAAGNLEWVTASENQLHAYHVLGRAASRGDEHYAAKLTRRKVRLLRRLWPICQAAGWTQERLGALFHVDSSTISRVVSRHAWQHC